MLIIPWYLLPRFRMKWIPWIWNGKGLDVLENSQTICNTTQSQSTMTKVIANPFQEQRGFNQFNSEKRDKYKIYLWWTPLPTSHALTTMGWLLERGCLWLSTPCINCKIIPNTVNSIDRSSSLLWFRIMVYQFDFAFGGHKHWNTTEPRRDILND